MSILLSMNSRLFHTLTSVRFRISVDWSFVQDNSYRPILTLLYRANQFDQHYCFLTSIYLFSVWLITITYIQILEKPIQYFQWLRMKPCKPLSKWNIKCCQHPGILPCALSITTFPYSKANSHCQSAFGCNSWVSFTGLTGTGEWWVKLAVIAVLLLSLETGILPPLPLPF